MTQPHQSGEASGKSERRPRLRPRAGSRTVPPMKRLLFLPLLMVALTLPAAEPVYNETADARAEVQQAIAQAAGAHQSVLVVFGANWCPDCRVLDAAFKQGPAASLVAKEFKVVKVNIGRYDRNMDLAQGYGIDLKKGIPTVAILSGKGDVIYTTKESELADARHLGDDGILKFFEKAAAEVR